MELEGHIVDINQEGHQNFQLFSELFGVILVFDQEIVYTILIWPLDVWFVFQGFSSPFYFLKDNFFIIFKYILEIEEFPLRNTAPVPWYFFQIADDAQAVLHPHLHNSLQLFRNIIMKLIFSI